jgi:fumarate hydratase, class I
MASWSTSLLPLGEPPVSWVKLEGKDSEHWVTRTPEGVRVSPEALMALTQRAFDDISHFLRPGHLSQLRDIVLDGEASINDRSVAIDLLKNASVAAGGVLPMCQDTGTAMVYAKRGHKIVTDGLDAEYIESGIASAFNEKNLRYSQLAPLGTWDEVNTGTNLPAEVDIQLAPGDTYDFLFIAKGGGSANKTFLYQETKELLREDTFLAFMERQLRTIGTTACPPYHLAVVIGGTSADYTVKTAKLAAAHALDTLPTEGSPTGHGFRDRELEDKVLQLTRDLGIGAQFGGKYFCHDVRVVRLPRHTGSLPVAIAVSCSADRQAWGRITEDGVFIEALESEPAHYLPEDTLEALAGSHSPATAVDLNVPMPEILSQLSGLEVGSRVELTGRMVVARDLAHAAIREAMAKGEGLPQYLKDHPVYYAAPAKTPEGYASGSFGPTTGGRMDGYVEEFQAAGGSLVMLAKGNRSATVAEACKRYGGVYLAAVGGPAALIAADHIRHVEVLDFPELDLEAVYAIDVESFPAYVVIDAKGQDLFAPAGPPLIRLSPTRLEKEDSE